LFLEYLIGNFKIILVTASLFYFSLCQFLCSFDESSASEPFAEEVPQEVYNDTHEAREER
jgi:hypothetical protein